jgi:tripartite-type tricarboxylate transporter receptor subunit TctC
MGARTPFCGSLIAVVRERDSFSSSHATRHFITSLPHHFITSDSLMRVFPIFLAASALALALAAASEAAAQAWPARTVRVVIAFSPGGGTDISARLLAKRFSETLGQSFVPDNRAGAGGLVAAEMVAKAPPDGYNILVTTASLAVNVHLHKKIAFDPIKDLAPVSWLASVPLMLFVHSSVPAKSVKEFVALAKKRPDGMNGGSNGSGTTSHLALEMLKQAAGIKVVHIPYRAAARRRSPCCRAKWISASGRCSRAPITSAPAGSGLSR